MELWWCGEGVGIVGPAGIIAWSERGGGRVGGGISGFKSRSGGAKRSDLVVPARSRSSAEAGSGIRRDPRRPGRCLARDQRERGFHTPLLGLQDPTRVCQLEGQFSLFFYILIFFCFSFFLFEALSSPGWPPARACLLPQSVE